MADLTAEQEALLRGTSDEALLTTFASLTHRLHESRARLGSQDYRMAWAAAGAVSTVAQQRDVVQGEILRRMAPSVTPAPGHTSTHGITGSWRCTCGASGTSRAAFTAHLTEAVAR